MLKRVAVFVYGVACYGVRDGNPLERIVGYTSLCPALGTRLGKRAERLFLRPNETPIRLPGASRLLVPLACLYPDYCRLADRSEKSRCRFSNVR